MKKYEVKVKARIAADGIYQDWRVYEIEASNLATAGHRGLMAALDHPFVRLYATGVDVEVRCLGNEEIIQKLLEQRAEELEAQE